MPQLQAAATAPSLAPADVVAPIVNRLLGPTFHTLHPRLQHRFNLTSRDNFMFHAQGVMARVWRGPQFVPFLHIGAQRHIMFPDRGADIPFTLRNYAYTDAFGRETLTFTRDFAFPRRTRRFDETLVCSPRRAGAVMYAGTRQHHAAALPDGSLEFRSAGQRFYEGPIGFRFPMFFSGVVVAHERYNEDSRYEVRVEVSNRYWGRIFGDEGWFRGECIPCRTVPTDCRPRREECRE